MRKVQTFGKYMKDDPPGTLMMSEASGRDPTVESVRDLFHKLAGVTTTMMMSESSGRLDAAPLSCREPWHYCDKCTTFVSDVPHYECINDPGYRLCIRCEDLLQRTHFHDMTHVFAKHRPAENQ